MISIIFGFTRILLLKLTLGLFLKYSYKKNVYKFFYYLFSPYRPSPIWLVSNAALKGKASDRVETLSAPKQHHKDFKPNKPVYSIVSDAAKNARANDRLETLAKPKQYQELPIKPDSCWDYSEWQSDVPKGALNHDATGRTLQLSMPKILHKDYKETRPVIWQVTPASRKALPSIRVQQLARPKSRSQYKEDYDSSCWKVSSSAKNARATPRIEELSLPIPRKIKQKKQGGAPKNWTPTFFPQRKLHNLNIFYFFYKTLLSIVLYFLILSFLVNDFVCRFPFHIVNC